MIYLPESLSAEEIREDQEYDGVRITLAGMLNRARIPLLYYTNINPSQKVCHSKDSDRKYQKNLIRFQKEWGSARADCNVFPFKSVIFRRIEVGSGSSFVLHAKSAAVIHGRAVLPDACCQAAFLT